MLSNWGWTTPPILNDTSSSSSSSSSSLAPQKRKREPEEEENDDDVKRARVSITFPKPTFVASASQIQRLIDTWESIKANGGNEKYIRSVDGSTEILGKDILTLRPSHWLNDQIINFQIERMEKLIKENGLKVLIWSTFFYVKLVEGGVYDYDRVKRWCAKKTKEPIDSYTHIVVPLHLNKAHWALIIIEKESRQICYYDSIRERSHDVTVPMNHVLTWYKRQLKEENIIDDGKLWHLHAPEQIPQQSNAYDCGVFMLQYILIYALGEKDQWFNQEDVETIRTNMALSILEEGDRVV